MTEGELEPSDDFLGDESEAPEEALTLDDLHDGIRQAAAQAWEQGDYPRAVSDALFALRDMLRHRLGSTDDGVDLVNLIQETPPVGQMPRLPLTPYDSDSDRNMHRGLVQFLRGIVFFVRNPAAHDTESMFARDPVGALERLAIISLCARYVSEAAPVSAVVDAVEELCEPRFSGTYPAMDNLFGTIPSYRHLELLDALRGRARKAWESGDRDAVFLFVKAEFRLLRKAGFSDDMTDAIVARTEPLLARDATLELGVFLLPPMAFPRLQLRYRERVAAYVVEIARRAAWDDQGNEHKPEGGALKRLILALPDADRAAAVSAMTDAIRDTSHARRSITAVRIAAENDRGWRDDELTEFARAITETVAAAGGGLVGGLLVRVADELRTSYPRLHAAVLAGLRALEGQALPGTAEIDAAIRALTGTEPAALGDGSGSSEGD